MQAVAAILLQSINDTKLTNLAKSNVDYIDPYTTPVFYFNSLRELGAADVILQDDAISSMSAYSKIRDEDFLSLSGKDLIYSRKKIQKMIRHS